MLVLGTVAQGSEDGRWSRSDSEAALATVSPRARCVIRHEAPSLDPYAEGDGGMSIGIAQIHRYGLMPRFETYVRAYWDDAVPDRTNPFQAAGFVDYALRQGWGSHWTVIGACP
jgi:hypothetical protein